MTDHKTPCTATRPGLRCDLDAGHPGQHHDWLKIKDWDETTSQNWKG